MNEAQLRLEIEKMKIENTKIQLAHAEELEKVKSRKPGKAMRVSESKKTITIWGARGAGKCANLKRKECEIILANLETFKALAQELIAAELVA